MIGLGDPDKAKAGSTARLLDTLLRSNKPPEEKITILQDEYTIDARSSIREEMMQMSAWFRRATRAAAQELAQDMARDMAQDMA